LPYLTLSLTFSLDFDAGTLSFSHNGVSLGVAFDKIWGEVYPAVAFYNVGQELEILPKGFRASSPQSLIGDKLTLHGFSTLTETLLCISLRHNLSHRIILEIADHCNYWCNNGQKRAKTLSGTDIFLSTKQSSMLQQKFDICVGERIRTPIGIGELLGENSGRMWFLVGDNDSIWQFSMRQILAGRKKGYFFR
jgi:hypothetical protein